MKICINCGSEYSSNYCSRCGQKEISGRTSLSSIFTDFIQVVFLIESHVANTIKALVVSPGNFVTSYLKGKRQSFMAPLQFFLLFLTVYLLVFNWIGEEFMSFINQSIGIDAQAKVTPLGFDIRYIQSYVRKNLDLFYFLMPPILAYFYYLFFKKTRVNYAESLIFSIYLVAIGLVFSTFIVLISFINVKFMMLRLLIFIFYAYAMVQFSGSRKLLGVSKSIFAIILSYIVYGIIVSIITMAYFALI